MSAPVKEPLVGLTWCASCDEHVETSVSGECVQCDAVLDVDAFDAAHADDDPDVDFWNEADRLYDERRDAA